MLMNNFSNSNIEAGVDEAGRGSLAGPLPAAAVIFPKDYENDDFLEKLLRKVIKAMRYKLIEKMLLSLLVITSFGDVDFINAIR